MATADTSGGTISVVANNNCGSSTAQSLSIHAHSLPATPAIILGTDTLCAGSSTIYKTNPVPDATAYQWTLPTGWTGTSFTDSISILADTSGGIISVSSINHCGTSNAQSMAVVIKNKPDVPSIVSGDTAVCAGDSGLYKAQPVNSANSYLWSTPSGWSGSSTVDSISILTFGISGNITVMSVNECGNSLPDSLYVLIHALPTPQVTFLNDTLFSNYAANNQWNFSGIAISGATDDFYIPLSNGTYSVSVTDSITQCTGTSPDINVTNVGMKDIVREHSILAYPNPANEKIHILIPDDLLNASAAFVNMFGQIVSTFEFRERLNTIDVHSLSGGIYFLVVENGIRSTAMISILRN
jgi:hypothetical protein